jgi:hypothetical protein
VKKIIISILLGMFAVTTTQSQTITVNKENRTIAVTTTDSASAPADLAAIDVGYLVFAPDAQTAYANGSNISNAILKALLDAKISKQQIESSEQRLFQTRFNDSDNEDRDARRFSLTQSWIVTVPAENAAQALDIAIRAGANTSGHIEWSVTDDNALTGKAAAKALERARSIASNMAKGLGATLGQLVYASNEAPERSGYGFGSGAGIAGVLGRAPTPSPPPLAILGKQIVKSATVYAVFSIE